MRRRILLSVSLILSIILLGITLAEANHAMYVPGDNVYRDSGLIACSTEEASMKAIQGVTTVGDLTYASAREIAEANNCGFHRNPVNFTISEIICKAYREDGRVFTIAKATVINEEEKFTVLFTDSRAYHCGV